jgi:hypothetical protein
MVHRGPIACLERRRERRSMRRTLAVFALMMLAIACDPCAGTVGCRQDPELSVEGRLVDWSTGRSNGGAGITLLARGTSVTTTTGADGQFTLRTPVVGYGKTDYKLVVRPTGEREFTADLTCWITLTRGSGCPLGLVSSRPHVAVVAELSYRGSKDSVIAHAVVVFTRTFGAEIYGDSVTNDVITTQTNELGHVALLGPEVFSTSVSEVVGRLTVSLPPPLDSASLDTLRLPSTLAFRASPLLVALKVGPSIRYSYAFSGPAGNPVAGVHVVLRRTGGVATAPDTAFGVTDSTGVVQLEMQPLDRGVVNAAISVTPRAPSAPFIVDGIALATHDDDKAPRVGQWNVMTGTGSTPRRDRRW